MKAPAFWSQDGWTARLLAPLGHVYGAITVARMQREGLKAPCSVIAIGNLTAGGAGKTPTTIALAHALRHAGWQPVLVTRGYGGSEAGPILVDPDRHDAGKVGDEALLLARAAPTILSRRRAAALPLALAAGNLIILDDALQNPDLARDVTVAVIDADLPFGNGRVIPAGPLRAPVAAQAPYIDLLFAIGETPFAPPAGLAGKPLFSSVFTPDAAVMATLRDRAIIAFAGIGRPEKFFGMLRRFGIRLVATHAFADHHPFSDSEIAALLGEAERANGLLATTAKDEARLTKPQRDRLSSRLASVAVTLDVTPLAKAVIERLRSKRP
jgi:tetraacyldisaccharide 4'-kinase